MVKRASKSTPSARPPRPSQVPATPEETPGGILTEEAEMEENPAPPEATGESGTWEHPTAELPELTELPEPVTDESIDVKNEGEDENEPGFHTPLDTPAAEEPDVALEAETTDGDSTPPVSKTVIPGLDPSKLAPRATPGDAFEQNPLSAIREAAPDGVARHGLDDGTRVREALRSVIEEGESLKEAAREWNVAPSTIAEWRSRYQDLLAQHDESGTPLMEINIRPQVETSSYIPEAAREIFMENWERLVTATAAQPSDFVQSPGRIFLQTSPLTSWLFEDGRLERSILSGVVSVLIGIAILTSFLIAGRNPTVAVPLPEAAPREDLEIAAAAAVAQSFFKAANWEERLAMVRQPEAVRDMMAAYYKNHPDGPIPDAALTLAMPLRHLVNLSFDIPSLNRQHFLCVAYLNGRYLVDWESSSIYQEDLLNRLRASRSTEPTRIAVTVRKSVDSNYFNYAFSEAERWECYELGYPGLNLSLFGYAAKDSGDAINLDAMLGILEQHAVVLEVRFPPEAKSDNQVEIIHVLRNEWVPLDP